MKTEAETDRLRRINARATDSEHAAIGRAVDLWLARYGDDGPRTPEATAAALAAICAAWRAREVELLNDGR